MRILCLRDDPYEKSSLIFFKKLKKMSCAAAEAGNLRIKVVKWTGCTIFSISIQAPVLLTILVLKFEQVQFTPQPLYSL